MSGESIIFKFTYYFIISSNFVILWKMHFIIEAIIVKAIIVIVSNYFKFKFMKLFVNFVIVNEILTNYLNFIITVTDMILIINFLLNFVIIVLLFTAAIKFAYQIIIKFIKLTCFRIFLYLAHFRNFIHFHLFSFITY